MGGHFREPLGSFAARVYRIDLGGITQQNAADKGVSSLLNEFGCDREAWQDPVPDNLVMNPFFENQQLLLNPDGWILFPTEGAPSIASFDQDAVVEVDYAAARNGSGVACALRVITGKAVGTGLHLPLLHEVDISGLNESLVYELSFYARTVAGASADSPGLIHVAQTPLKWHYGDASPIPLKTLQSFEITREWKKCQMVIKNTGGTLNLLTPGPGVTYLSEPLLLVVNWGKKADNPSLIHVPQVLLQELYGEPSPISLKML